MGLKNKLGKLFGLLLIGISGLLGYCLYKIIEMIWLGFTTKDAWLLVGGGILAYFFGILTIIGIIAFFMHARSISYLW